MLAITPNSTVDCLKGSNDGRSQRSEAVAEVDKGLAQKMAKLWKKRWHSDEESEAGQAAPKRKRIWRRRKRKKRKEIEETKPEVDPPLKNRPSFLPLKRVAEKCESSEEDKYDSVIREEDEILLADDLEKESTSAKKRLMDIMHEDKKRRKRESDISPSSSSSSSPDCGAVPKEVTIQLVSSSPFKRSYSTRETIQKSPSFLERGSLLVSNMRSSLRKMKWGKSPANEVEVTLNDVQPLNSTKVSAAEGEQCNESQDSGLGEDSDFDPALRDSSNLSTSPRTPTPATGIMRSTTTSSSLRKVSSASSSNSGGLVAKKHVIIREPSLSKLPSARRKRKCTARIYSRAARLPSIAATGTVETQWGRLCAMAYAEVIRNVNFAECEQENNNFFVRLVFDPDLRGVKQDLQEMDSSDDIAALIHSLYKILFFDWLRLGLTAHLSIIVHCVQRFLVIVIDIVHLDMDDRLRFARICRDLQRSSEMNRYRDLSGCLDRTRRVFVDFWCTLLRMPFSRSASPTVSLIQKSIEAPESKSKVLLEPGVSILGRN